MSKHLVRASMFCLTKIPACICKAACCPGKALCAHRQPANASRCLNNAMTCLRVRLLVDLSGNKFDDRQCSARLPGDPPFSNGCLLRFFSPAGFSFFSLVLGPISCFAGFSGNLLQPAWISIGWSGRVQKTSFHMCTGLCSMKNTNTHTHAQHCFTELWSGLYYTWPEGERWKGF